VLLALIATRFARVALARDFWPANTEEDGYLINPDWHPQLNLWRLSRQSALALGGTLHGKGA